MGPLCPLCDAIHPTSEGFFVQTGRLVCRVAMHQALSGSSTGPAYADMPQNTRCHSRACLLSNKQRSQEFSRFSVRHDQTRIERNYTTSWIKNTIHRKKYAHYLV